MSLIDSSRVLKFQARLEKLEQDQIPLWGNFTAGNMIDHLCNSIQFALGDRVAKPALNDTFGKLIFPIAMLFPFPRNTQTSPEFLEESGLEFAKNKDRLSEQIADFHRAVLTDPMHQHRHPAFGTMDRIKSAKLLAKHIEHHFGQFEL
jgi:hypothetical protein